MDPQHRRGPGTGSEQGGRSCSLSLQHQAPSALTRAGRVSRRPWWPDTTCGGPEAPSQPGHYHATCSAPGGHPAFLEGLGPTVRAAGSHLPSWAEGQDTQPLHPLPAQLTTDLPTRAWLPALGLPPIRGPRESAQTAPPFLSPNRRGSSRIRVRRSSEDKVGAEFPGTRPSRSDTRLSSSHLCAQGFWVLPHRPPADSTSNPGGPHLRDWLPVTQRPGAHSGLQLRGAQADPGLGPNIGL